MRGFPYAFILVALVVLVSGCTATDNGTSGTNVTNGSAGLELIEISEEGVMDQDLCSERGLEDKVVVLESAYCGACRVAVPILQEIEQELNASFVYLDLSEPGDLETMKSFGIIPRYTPTTMVGCRALIGSYSKEQFMQAIEPFWDSL